MFRQSFGKTLNKIVPVFLHKQFLLKIIHLHFILSTRGGENRKVDLQSLLPPIIYTSYKSMNFIWKNIKLSFIVLSQNPLTNTNTNVNIAL